MLLKDGTTVNDPRLDRLYEEDWNSLKYPITAKLEKVQPLDKYEPRSQLWYIGTVLDQGQEGACVGFAFAHEALAVPNAISYLNDEPLDAKFAKEKIYWEAQKIDEWTGGAYPGAVPINEGSSVLSGAKIMQQLNLYTSYYWALDLKQLVLGIGHTGPAVLGINWKENMYTPDSKGFIHVSGETKGGHAILAHGVELVWIDNNSPKTFENVDKKKSFFWLHNSWGTGWGINGDCYISLSDMEVLLNEKGDACLPSRGF